MNLENLEKLYDKHYKKLLIIPIVILALSLLVIIVQYKRTGDFLNKDVSLKGGVSATIYTDKIIDIKDLEGYLKAQFSKSDISVRRLAEFGTDKQIGFLVEADNLDSNKLKEVLENKIGIKLTEDNYFAEEVGASLGEAFYQQMAIAMGLAFLFMAIVVFVIFRGPVPSGAVVLAAFADITSTIAVVDLIGLKVSTAGIAAFMMLIGYSVDTDMLLTTRVLRKVEGTVFSRMFDSMKTGLTMTLTTTIVALIGIIVSESPILKEVFIILLIGLFFDMFNTWITNAAILYRYAKKKGMT